MILVRLLLRSSVLVFFFQAEDGIRDLVRSRGLGDVYKRQVQVSRDRYGPWSSYADDQGCRRRPPSSRDGRQDIPKDLSLIHI